jgi:hypothetical protein
MEGQIRALLADFPEMPTTVIAERVGWRRSMTVLRERVRELRPSYRPLDPSSRTTYQPGELGPSALGAPQAGSPPVLVMLSGYSRRLMARMIPTGRRETSVARAGAGEVKEVTEGRLARRHLERGEAHVQEVEVDVAAYGQLASASDGLRVFAEQLRHLRRPLPVLDRQVSVQDQHLRRRP